ncbi:hypothetical protein SNARM312S_01380 [Streptomyces narbonensis]
MSLLHPSYPAPRYFGEKGEVSARFRPAATEPEFVSEPGGTTYHYLSTATSTDGEYGLYRVEMGPEAGGPTRTSTRRCRRRSSCSPAACGSSTGSSG